MRKFLAVFLGGILILAQGVMTFASSDVDTKNNTKWLKIRSGYQRMWIIMQVSLHVHFI